MIFKTNFDIFFLDVYRFVPPQDFNLTVLTLELDYLSRAKARDEQVSLPTLDRNGTVNIIFGFFLVADV